MATPPFGAARIAALKENEQSGVLTLLKQWVDNPQFFCCISGTAVGVLKDPVCILESDRVVCTDEDVTLDFSRSWSPTDSLAGTAYTVHWGDGSTTNGNFPDPRNPAAETETYVGGYDAVGFYDIVLDITDTLGATSSCRIQVYAEICPPPPLLGPVPGEPVEGDAVAVGAHGSILPYTTDWTSSPPTWNFAAAGGLMPADWLDLMYTRAPAANRLFGAAWSDTQIEHTGTDPIISEYTPLPLGTGAWVTKVTALDIATELGHSADYYGVMVSRMISGLTEAQEEWAWAVGICYYNAGGGASDRRALYYCAHTQDAWDSIHSCVEIETQSYGGASIHLYSNLQFGIAQDLHTGYLFVAIGRWVIPGHVLYLTLWRSIDNGANWVIADQDTTWDFWSGGASGSPITITDVWIPYMNDWFGGGTVFWSGCCLEWDLGTDRPHPGRIYKSTANGAAAVRLDTDGSAILENDPEQAPTRLIGPYNGANYVWAISALDDAMGHGYDPAIYKWESGVGWSEWGSVADDPGKDSPAGWVRLTTPDMFGVQLPTHIGWHTEPYETSAGGDEDKGNRSAEWILPVEY